MMISLGVLHDVKFSFSSGKEFVEFIKYMEDESKTNIEVAQKFFANFLDYMDNPNKAVGLFSEECKYLTKEQRLEFVEYYRIGQERQSVFWQDLFSFKNEWLEKYGLMDIATNEVDDVRLMSAVKCTMDVLIKEEGLQNYKWLASMHHNTDNRHFHVSGVELNPSREWKWHTVYKTDYKGKYIRDEQGRKIDTGEKVYQPIGMREKSTLTKMKRVFVNQLIQSAEKLKQIDEVARGRLIGELKEKQLINDPIQKENLVKLYEKLPNDKRLWNMKNARKNFFGKEVDKVVETYLGEHNEAYQMWEKRVLALTKEYEQAYSTIEIEGADMYDDITMKTYSKNSLDDLKYRLGNAVLSQIRLLDKERAAVGLNRKHFVQQYIEKNKEKVVDVDSEFVSLTENVPSESEDIEVIQSIDSMIDFESISLHEDKEQIQNERDPPSSQEISGKEMLLDRDSGFASLMENVPLELEDIEIHSTDSRIDFESLSPNENSGKVQNERNAPPSQKDPLVEQKESMEKAIRMLVFTKKDKEEARYLKKKRKTVPSQKISSKGNVVANDLEFASLMGSVPSELEEMNYVDSIMDLESIFPSKNEEQVQPKHYVSTFERVAQAKGKLIFPTDSKEESDYQKSMSRALPFQKQPEDPKQQVHEVEAYVKDGQVHVIFQKKGNQNNRYQENERVSSSQKEMFQQRYRQAKINRTLSGIDRNVRMASESWKNERVFDELQEKIRLEEQRMQRGMSY